MTKKSDFTKMTSTELIEHLETTDRILDAEREPILTRINALQGEAYTRAMQLFSARTKVSVESNLTPSTRGYNANR